MVIKRTKIIGVVSAVSFFGSLALLIGFIVLLRTSEAELAERKIQIAEMQNNEQALSSLVRLVEETTTERGEIVSRILHEEDVIDFLALIEELGREQGVELNTTSLNVASVDNLYDELQISVSVTGSRASVIHMLKLFETLPYQSYISRARISQTSGAEANAWSGTFAVHVTKYK